MPANPFGHIPPRPSSVIALAFVAPARAVPYPPGNSGQNQSHAATPSSELAAIPRQVYISSVSTSTSSCVNQVHSCTAHICNRACSRAATSLHLASHLQPSLQLRDHHYLLCSHASDQAVAAAVVGYVSGLHPCSQDSSALRSSVRFFSCVDLLGVIFQHVHRVHEVMFGARCFCGSFFDYG